MSKMTVEDTSLTAVADAIRTKGGTTDPLVFPDGFVSAIGNISGGGTTNILTPIVDKTITKVTADMLEGCTSVGNHVFNSCNKLLEVELPETCTSIGNYAFYICTSLSKVKLPETITSFGQYSFATCIKLVSISIPKGITSIPDYSFNTCYSLASLTIPENVTKIGNYSFHHCGFQTVEMKPTTPPSIMTTSFLNCKELTTIIVPKGSLDAYKTATNWSAYADLMVEAEV